MPFGLKFAFLSLGRCFVVGMYALSHGLLSNGVAPRSRKRPAVENHAILLECSCSLAALHDSATLIGKSAWTIMSRF